jgi:hypothetical protein
MLDFCTQPLAKSVHSIGLSKIATKIALFHFIQMGQKGPRVASNKNNFFPQGDSGGPLIYYNGQQPIQIGVLEFGHNMCGYNESAYAAYISVPYFRNWIDYVLP